MPNLTQVLHKSRQGHARHIGRNFEKFTNYKLNMRTKRFETLPTLRPYISEVRPRMGAGNIKTEEIS